jgi:hypothetical protein
VGASDAPRREGFGPAVEVALAEFHAEPQERFVFRLRALAMETRMALTLRMAGGLSMPEIARAFLVQEAAMGQRITREKAKIKAARIPYRVPSAEDLRRNARNPLNSSPPLGPPDTIEATRAECPDRLVERPEVALVRSKDAD